MKSTTYSGLVCKQKLVGGSDREQRVHEIRSFCRHDHTVLTRLATPPAQESCWPNQYWGLPLKDFAMDISTAALVNASTQMQKSQVAQTAQVLDLKEAMDTTKPPGR